jgi:VCBS repeat-containing protein
MVNGAKADYPPLNQWQEYPGTIPEDAVDNSAAACALWAWTSALYDSDGKRLFLPRNGGHLDQCKGQSLMLDILGAVNGTASWVRVEPVQTFTGPGVIAYSSATETGCFAPPNGPPDQHHYDAGLMWLGGNRGFHGGNPGGGSAQCPTAAFFEIPANPSDPWTWTPVPAAVPYVGIGVSARFGDNMYFIKRSGTSAVINKDTGALVSSNTQWRGVIVNGVETQKPSGSVASSAISAGDVNEDGLFCWGHTTAIYCSNTQGVVNGNNDDSWPRLMRRPVGSGAPVGSPQALITAGAYDIIAWNDKFIIHLGGSANCSKLIVFDPDDDTLSNAGDTWTLLSPATGPSVCSSLPYQKDAIVELPDGREFLAFLPGDSMNMWGYGLTDPVASNVPPVAVDDSYVFAEDTQLAGNVLANDGDPDEDEITATVTEIPTVGTLALNADGAFTYDPPANFFGQVTFTYTVSDGEFTDDALVTLNVTAVDDAAVVQDESFDVLEEGTLTDTVAANDNDIDSPLVYEFMSADGFVGNADGSFTYTGPQDFFGVLNIDYSANGILGTLTIQVADVPDTISTPDFASRIAAAGVFYSDPMDTACPVTSSEPRGCFLNGGSGPNSVTPHVENGALRFDILNGQGAGGAGQHYVKFMDPTILNDTIQKGESFYVQWRQLMPESFVHQHWTNTSGGVTAFKILGLNEGGNALCTSDQWIVVRGGWGEDVPPAPKRGGLAMYVGCGPFYQIEVSEGIIGGSGKWDSQPMVDPSEITTPSPFRSCYLGSRTNCIQLEADVWTTYQLAITFAENRHTTFDAKTMLLARIELWQQVDGQAPVKVIDIVKEVPAKTIGRVWFLPYMTEKDPAVPHPDTYTLIDEVILSRQRIPDRPF